MKKKLALICAGLSVSSFAFADYIELSCVENDHGKISNLFESSDFKAGKHGHFKMKDGHYRFHVEGGKGTRLVYNTRLSQAWAQQQGNTCHEQGQTQQQKQACQSQNAQQQTVQIPVQQHQAQVQQISCHQQAQTQQQHQACQQQATQQQAVTIPVQQAQTQQKPTQQQTVTIPVQQAQVQQQQVTCHQQAQTQQQHQACQQQATQQQAVIPVQQAQTQQKQTQQQSCSSQTSQSCNTQTSQSSHCSVEGALADMSLCDNGECVKATFKKKGHTLHCESHYLNAKKGVKAFNLHFGLHHTAACEASYHQD